MDLKIKLAVLDEIYRIYEDFVGKLELVCRRYCAHCCTRNVTLTSLEAYKLAEYLLLHGKKDLFEIPEAESHKKRFQPLMTINSLAAMCMRGEEPPQEENEASWGACPLLRNNECPVYVARPFGCRCLVSKQNCGETGYADTDPFVMTVNNVFLQYIEHVDTEGFSGNFTDMLLFMASENHRDQYGRGTLKSPDKLIPNHPMPVLMIPPEHRGRIHPILKAIQNINMSESH